MANFILKFLQVFLTEILSRSVRLKQKSRILDIEKSDSVKLRKPCIYKENRGFSQVVVIIWYLCQLTCSYLMRTLGEPRAT